MKECQPPCFYIKKNYLLYLKQRVHWKQATREFYYARWSHKNIVLHSLEIYRDSVEEIDNMQFTAELVLLSAVNYIAHEYWSMMFPKPVKLHMKMSTNCMHCLQHRTAGTNVCNSWLILQMSDEAVNETHNACLICWQAACFIVTHCLRQRQDKNLASWSSRKEDKTNLNTSVCEV